LAIEGAVASTPSKGPEPELTAGSSVGKDYPTVGPSGRIDDVGSTKPRPWIRFWAKILDVLISTIVLGVLLGIMFPRWTAETNQRLLGLALFACSVPINALLLSSFGTTIGKSLFNVRVTHNGERLQFGAALRREFACFVRGFCLGLPVIYLITMIVAYRDLKASGSSSWDRDNGNVVSHKDPSVAGVVGAVALLILALAVMVWGNVQASQGY
jgi:uncharacterized RDD family membrane protein YckC